MDLPQPRFFLFGMGDRPKLLYRAGRLFDAVTREPVAAWPIRSDRILPSEYRVEMTHRDGRDIAVFEDQAGVWVEQGGKLQPLGSTRLTLPRFETFGQSALLRVLHHELLINMVDGQAALPLPNLFAYRHLKPWRRNAAMMAMALKLTGNVNLLANWIGALADPFDRNNAGTSEPDNLGQTLYLISLVGSADHPLVEEILAAAERFRAPGGDYIVGLTDGAEHPVYQTKWLKYGLASLKLDDFWRIPDLPDSYSDLFWMDYRDQPASVGLPLPDPPGRFTPRQCERYPYLPWAQAHFRNAPPPMDLSNPGYPMTWEAHASQADYSAMAWIDPTFTAQRICTPHSWHAAEMFLYLIERD